jgi:aerobic carbon-monoxide dehydrogenase medium subunit
MFPARFDYQRVESIDEALAALAEHGGDARILAGGQSLIPAMRFRLARPALLVDINRLDELAYIREDGGVLRIGARTRDSELEHWSGLARFAMIGDASMVVADPVVRQMGTVVGSLCHNDPAGDWPVVALAGRAEVVVRNAKGERTVPIDEFLVDSFTTAVGDGEFATEVRFPAPSDRSAGAYAKIERKVGDFATAAAAVRIDLAADGTVADASIALGAAGPMAMRAEAAERALRGAKPSKGVVAAAADAARAAAQPSEDNRGSVEFKQALAGVLVARALTKTFERLGVGGLS